MSQALRLFVVVLVATFLAGCGGGGSGGQDSNAPRYAVGYDGNGHMAGSAPVDAKSYAAGETVSVAGNDGHLARTGYSFSGWNTQPDGSGDTYSQAQTFRMGNSDVTLYARWSLNPTYRVTYDGNGADGGNVPIDSGRYEMGQAVTVLGNSDGLVRAGYTFAGWNTQADGMGSGYTETQTFVMGGADTTLYAVWTANPTYTVTYDGNGEEAGTAPVDSTHYEQGQKATVLGNSGNLARAGHTFAGWNTKTDGTGTPYTAGQSLTLGNSDVTLYAVWTVNPTWSVTYDGNGNSGGIVPVDSTAYEEGQTVTVLGNTGVLVRTSYAFAGWNTRSDGTGDSYVASDSFAMGTSNVTLYAVWSPQLEVRIKQVYSWGGFLGAPFNQDFVELFNPSLAAVDMTGWSLQYASAANAYSYKFQFPPTLIPAGGHLLVSFGAAGANGAPLPAADLAAVQGLGSVDGKVALVRNGTLLTCGTADNRCNAPEIADMVGYGVNATDYEGSGAASTMLSPNVALMRINNGCTDNNENSTDLVLVPMPDPLNSASAATGCF
jgi:uncharacterized repeat protein (TIGR02543 family)